MASPLLSEAAATAEGMSTLEVEFEVLGMKCGSCVSKVERAVRGLDLSELIDVRVNLLSESASVSLRAPKDGDLDALAENIRQAIVAKGLQATVTKMPERQPQTISNILQLEVLGMSCGSCVAAVERALRAMDVVEDVSVNLLAESASVRLKVSAKEAVDRVLEAVEDIGFQASVKSRGEAPSGPAEEEEAIILAVANAAE
ncbi:HMA5, partial [Symbiodinium pilosum]